MNYEMSNSLNQDLVDDLDFFHSTRKNSFSKLLKTASKLKNYWKKRLLGLFSIGAIGGICSYFVFGTISDPSLMTIGFAILFAIAFMVYSVASYLWYFSKYKFLETVLENKFSKYKLLKISEFLNQAAIETGREDEYNNFTFNIQKGAISRSQVEFYIDMLDHIFRKKSTPNLTSNNVPHHINVNIEDNFEDETKKSLDMFQDLNFFEKPTTKKHKEK